MRAIVLGVFFSALFAILTVYTENMMGMCITATQIPVLPFVLLVLMVLLINPVCRLIRIARIFTIVELIIIFVMGSVSSGVSTFGLTPQLLPLVGGLFNPEWNNKQSEWNRYVVPFINNEYFLSDSGRGIQQQAKEWHAALEEASEIKTIYETARRNEIARSRLLDAEKQLQELESSVGPVTEKKKRGLGIAKITVENSRRMLDDSRSDWECLSEGRDLPSLETVLETYPLLVQSASEKAERAESLLAERETEAFRKVTLFRRGLPKELSAYPGFFPLSGDDTRSYFGRMRRLVHGKSAVASLKSGIALAHSETGDLSPEARQQLDAYLEAAAGKLAPLTEASDVEADLDVIRSRAESLSEQRLSITLDIRQKNEERRQASRSAALAMEGTIKNLEKDLADLGKTEKKLMLAKERNERELNCADNVRIMVDKLEALRSEVKSESVDADDFVRIATGLLPEFVSLDASLLRYFIGEVPWVHWLRPLGKWAMIIALTYLILMSLNVLIFRQWCYNEKLTYPLAELPKALVGDSDLPGTVPLIFKNGLFWTGFAIAGIVIGWNLLCATQIIPGLTPFGLVNSWYKYVNNTEFHALRGTRSMIFFTMIGLAFLIPKNISFSLWAFHVAYMCLMLFMVWAGHGQDERSFPSDWRFLLNFRTAIGHGALMMFASVVLYKCRRYILCGFSPSLVSQLEEDERRELISSSLIFVSCSFLLVAFLWLDMGANLYHVIFSYVVIVLLTVGLVRAVTEGGLLGFQAWTNPFHLIRAFLGLDKTWTSASLFAPIMVYYSVLFLDIKTFIAPAMANAIKLRDDFKMKRGAFHVSVLLAVLAAAVTAIIASLILSYARGADSMNGWFYTSYPRGTFEGLRSMIKDAPPPSPSDGGWVIFGAVGMAALLYFRQIIFWLPHPLGLVMFVNPMMGAYWFSIMLGWLCNAAVTKYGNKNTYQRARGFFIGLIMGELFIVTLALVFSIVLEKYLGIDLNRN